MKAAHRRPLQPAPGGVSPVPDLSALRITPAILARVAEIDEFKGAWRALGRFAPERLAAMRDAALIESVGACARLDGAALADRDIERLLGAAQQPLLPTRDEQTVAGYARLLRRIHSRWDVLAPTEGCLGELRREWLGERRRHVRVADRDDGTAALLAWMRSEESGESAHSVHPLLRIAAFMAAFLRLRLQGEENGGLLSRALMVLLLLRSGYTFLPYVSLEGLIEQHRERYERTLRAAGAADWSAWLECFLQLLQEHKRRLERRLERERASVGELSELSARLLGVVHEHGRLTIAAAIKATGGRRGTIKDHIHALCRQGQLALHGAGRGAWYSPVA